MANDVRCTHGATLGQVDREQLFYLMARGLSRAEAERLIVRGFFQDVLDRVELESVRNALAAALEARLVFAAAAPAEEMLRYETGDWIFTAPATLGTQADLELNGRQVQLCSDEIVALTGHRPPAPAKFTVQWVIDESVWYSAASAMGWVNSVPPSFRLVDDAS